MSYSESIKLLAIDPADCGCTECIVGEYRPEKDATPEEILSCLKGEISDHTDSPIQVTVSMPIYEKIRVETNFMGIDFVARVDNLWISNQEDIKELPWKIA